MKKGNFILFVICVGLALGLGIFLFLHSSDEKFPYAKSSAQVQILRKERSVPSNYSIQAGDITGEASLTQAATPAAAETLVSSQLLGVQSTFRNSVAPYPGQITGTIECEARKFVEIKTLPFGAASAEAIFAVASARRIFGVCALAEIRYAAVIFSAYDILRKQVLTIKLFKPVTEASQVPASQNALAAVLATLEGEK